MKFKKTISEIIFKAIDIAGFSSAFLGIAGLAGNVEAGKSVTIPLLLIISGGLMMWATSLMEIIENEKRNSHHTYSYSRDDSRPYFLR